MSVPRLQSSRLRLEPLDPAVHAPGLRALYDDPRFAAYLASGPVPSSDAKAEYLRVFEGLPEGQGDWVAFVRGGDVERVIGRFSLRPWMYAEDGDPLEVGWFLAVDQLGKGLAAEGIRAVLRYAAWGLGLEAVIALVRLDNQRSRALAERLGGVVTRGGRWYGEVPSERYDIALPRIRDGRPGDAPSVARVWREANTVRLGSSVGTEPDPSGEQMAEQRMASSAVARICEVDGRVVGMAVGLAGREDDGQGDAPVPGLLHISMVGTEPRYWGWGIGEALMRSVLQAATTAGFTRAQLFVVHDNRRARELYERVGFGCTQGVRTGRSGELMVRYELSLTGGADDGVNAGVR